MDRFARAEVEHRLADPADLGGRVQPGPPQRLLLVVVDGQVGQPAYRTDLGPSPLFGKMSRDELTRLHLIHCAHHLSFLTPKAN